MKQKSFESVLAIVVALVAIYWFRRANGWLLAALAIGLSALLFPAAARAIHWAWTRLSLLAGDVSGKLLLSLVYILVLVPLSFLARRFGGAGLRRKAGGTTYFTERNHRYKKDDLMHPW